MIVLDSFVFHGVKTIKAAVKAAMVDCIDSGATCYLAGFLRSAFQGSCEPSWVSSYVVYHLSHARDCNDVGAVFHRAGAGWEYCGTSILGVMDRFLVSPVSRVAIIAGRLLHLAFTTVVQSSILITLGFVLGARYPGGIGGIVVLIGCAVLVGVSFGALSNALALTMRKMESVIGAVNFILLPMTFLSSILMANTLMPPWIRKVSLVNPVNWAVEAGRTAISESPDWTAVLIRVACITTFALVCGWVATRAFRSYQRSA